MGRKAWFARILGVVLVPVSLWGFMLFAAMIALGLTAGWAAGQSGLTGELAPGALIAVMAAYFAVAYAKSEPW
jgi:hypothetical protein